MNNIAKKEEILQAASKIFAYYGYEKTTLDDIGKKVGLNKTSLYYYYKNKELIFVDVLHNEINGFLAHTKNKLKNIKGYRDKILTYLIELLNYSKNATNLSEISNENIQKMRPFIKKLSDYFMNEHTQYISKTLKTGVEKGEFKECDTDKVAISILKISAAITSKNDDCFDKVNTTDSLDNSDEKEMIFTISLVLDGLNK